MRYYLFGGPQYDWGDLCLTNAKHRFRDCDIEGLFDGIDLHPEIPRFREYTFETYYKLPRLA